MGKENLPSKEAIHGNIKDIITKISSSINSKCSATNTNIQIFRLEDLNTTGCSKTTISNINQEINSSFSFTCMQENEVEISALIKENLLESTSKLVVDNKKKEEIANYINNINFKLVLNCMSDTLNVQSIHFGKINVECADNGVVTIDNINQLMEISVVSKCMQINKLTSDIYDIINDTRDKGDKPSESKQTSEPDIIEKSGTDNTGAIIGGVFGGILFILIVGYIVYKSNKSRQPPVQT